MITNLCDYKTETIASAEILNDKGYLLTLLLTIKNYSMFKCTLLMTILIT